MNALVKQALWKSLPRGWAVNWLFAVPYFHRYHRRFPRSLRSPQAGLEDYIFHRMIRPFSDFEARCVDKETAKEEALRLAPGLKAAPTQAVMALGPQTKLKDVENFLAPFWGKAFVAKATHGSGKHLFLDEAQGHPAAPALELLINARKNYFFKRFESQYKSLAPKLLVEESLGRPSPPDFRFFASRGTVFFCQYDEGGQPGHPQAFFAVPDHALIPLRTACPLPDPLPPKPAH
ncbi:MAG TPA: hypothetical protein VMU88_01620, partial [bacterium]|nr:hypothetical protein [bacterium]